MVIVRQEYENLHELPDFNFENINEIFVSVDIGTTNIVIDIYDCSESFKEKRLIRYSELSKQTILGKDVAMRIMHCMNGKLSILHEQVVSQIEEMISFGLLQLGLKDKLSDIAIRNMHVTGNTTMCHIFLNEDPSGLKGAPFKMSYEGDRRVKGEDIGFRTLKNTEVYVFPAISAFVGADALTAFMASGIYDTSKVSFLVDIGTNAEIILNARGKLYATSVAAGPAFEGNILSCGMGAKEGAVSKVSCIPSMGSIILSVLRESEENDGRPKGILASGYIDLLSHLKKLKIMTPDGYLISREEAEELLVNKDYISNIEEVNGVKRFYLLRGNEEFDLMGGRRLKAEPVDKALNKPKSIYITQDDIRALQLAKAAIKAGVCSLLKEAGISKDEVDNTLIAGMFGSHMDISNCKSINMLPEDMTGSVESIGNAALDGAGRAFFDREFFKDCLKIKDSIVHVQLADSSEFKELYMDSFEF
ncbi:MAG: ASKHA domain-containing protein [Lachnospiraceae bacterium]|nr:ASKHA domain-containing protein [Lachnospiraceae bacterium]